ncbi:MAG: pectate lyase, partial [Gemmatimonadaceae bacterium]
MNLSGLSIGVVSLGLIACAGGGVAQGKAAPIPASVPPTFPPEPKRDPLLSGERVAKLAPDANAWFYYLAKSRAQRVKDSAVMDAELRRLGRTEMTPAPYTHGFEITRAMTHAWLASDSARTLAENLLSFQTPNGGWSKHVDYEKGPRAPGQSWFSESNKWQWIATIDNNSTTEQMQFLLMLDSVQPNQRYRDAWLRGFQYLVSAQFPNG